jgi:hypothetical protein
MQNAHSIHAHAASGLLRRRNWLRALALGCAMCACVSASAAVAGGGRDDQERRAQHGERAQPQRMQDEPRMQESPRMRDAPRMDSGRAEAMRQEQMRAYEEQRRAAIQAQQQQQDGFRRNGRLTPDERRDLRRQINEAGQDIYPNTPRR